VVEEQAEVSLGWHTSSHTARSGGSSCIEVGVIPWRKSSYSSQSGGSSCVEVGAIPWRKSSHSTQSGATSCVEAGHVPRVILIRDTTDHGQGLTLQVSPSAWRDFTSRIRASKPVS
jgi:hypothetical protein